MSLLTRAAVADGMPVLRKWYRRRALVANELLWRDPENEPLPIRCEFPSADEVCIHTADHEWLAKRVKDAQHTSAPCR